MVGWASRMDTEGRHAMLSNEKLLIEDAEMLPSEIEQENVSDAVDQHFIPPLPHCALLFDIDGTLIDLAPTPDAVHVSSDLRQTLAHLYELTGGALALVSGRGLGNIDMIFHPLWLPAVGAHGAEIRFAREGAPTRVDAKLGSQLKSRFAAIADLNPGIILEDKGHSLAIHYRLAPDFQAAIYQSITAIRADLAAAPIEILAGKCVVEIKPSGFSKATAVRTLMSRKPFAGRHPVFIGDDVTDDTVFAIMPDLGGTAFSVGRKVAGLNGYFHTPADVRAWLSRLVVPGSQASRQRA